MVILMVDDVPELMESAASALALHGHTVLKATTSQEALDLVLENRIDVAILDWDLGLRSDYDGPMLAQKIKRYEPMAGVCIWSGVTRDRVEDADIQIVKGLSAIDELFEWLAYEEGVRSC